MLQWHILVHLSFFIWPISSLGSVSRGNLGLTKSKDLNIQYLKSYCQIATPRKGCGIYVSFNILWECLFSHTTEHYSSVRSVQISYVETMLHFNLHFFFISIFPFADWIFVSSMTCTIVPFAWFSVWVFILVFWSLCRQTVHLLSVICAVITFFLSLQLLRQKDLWVFFFHTSLVFQW